MYEPIYLLLHASVHWHLKGLEGRFIQRSLSSLSFAVFAVVAVFAVFAVLTTLAVVVVVAVVATTPCYSELSLV